MSSSSSVQITIERIQREINQLNRELTSVNKKEADLTTKIYRARERANRTSSASSVKTYLREIDRLQREIITIQKKRADLTKRIGEKTERLHKEQQRLFETQERERKSIMSQIDSFNQSVRERQFATLDSAATIIDDTAHKYDAFISYATEDKEEIARPLAEALINLGFNIWFDEFALTVGDSLRRSIDRGLAGSRFGIVILSQSFFAKQWPQYELDGMIAKESYGGKVILPLWHRVTKDDVMKYSPTLADKVALNTATHSLDEIVKQLASVIDQAKN